MTEQVMDTYRRMLNVEEVPPQLIAKYDKFKRLLDRVDGRLNAQGMAVVAVMAGYDLDAGEFPGADTIDESDDDKATDDDKDDNAGEDGPMGEETEKMVEQVEQEMQQDAIDPPDGYVAGMTVKVWFDNRANEAIFLGMEDGKCKVKLADGSERTFEEHEVKIPE